MGTKKGVGRPRWEGLGFWLLGLAVGWAWVPRVMVYVNRDTTLI